jgi:hypothetical protein
VLEGECAKEMANLRTRGALCVEVLSGGSKEVGSMSIYTLHIGLDIAA